jgi:O-succinylbenzoate synthase
MSGQVPEGFVGLPSVSHELAEVLVHAGIDRAVPFHVATRTRFRGVSARSGLLLHGGSGWSEFSPFDEYPPEVARRWFDAAVDAATRPLPPALRTHVPVNVTVPAVGPEEAAAAVLATRARTAKVKIAEAGQRLEDDIARVLAVREALGPGGAIRLDANAGWDLATACEVLPQLAEAAGGLQYVEQPCATLADLAAVRRRTGVAVAADESLRLDRVTDPDLLHASCDVIVLKVQPLGGVHAALDLAASIGLPAVVSSALETSIGLAVAVRLAAALPDLPFACGLDTARLLVDDVGMPLESEDGAHCVARADELLAQGPRFVRGAAAHEAIWRRLGHVLSGA